MPAPHTHPPIQWATQAAALVLRVWRMLLSVHSVMLRCSWNMNVCTVGEQNDRLLDQVHGMDNVKC